MSKRHKVTEFRTVYIEENGKLVPYLVDPSGDLIAQDQQFNPGGTVDMSGGQMPSAQELEQDINQGLATGELNPAATGSDHLARFIENAIRKRKQQKDAQKQAQQQADQQSNIGQIDKPQPQQQQPQPSQAAQDALKEAEKQLQQMGLPPSMIPQVMPNLAPDYFAQEYINQQPDPDKPKQGATTDDPRKVLPHGVDPRDMPNLNDPAFRSRLSSIMNDNRFDRRLKGRTRGKLDMSRLYKAKTRARTIFTQKESRKGKEYNIVICVDESSSMGGSDIDNAADVAAFLSQSFWKLNLNLAVVGFNNGSRVHKKFEDTLKASELREEIRKHCGGGTDSFDGLKQAYDLLPISRTGKNIVLFITDGELSASHSRAMEHLIAANEDRVEPVGIGVGGANPGSVFPHKIKINDIHDLKPKIIENLRKQVRRG